MMVSPRRISPYPRSVDVGEFQVQEAPRSPKKKLVVGILNHLIEQIDDGEKDSEFEIILKTMVPPMVDSFAAMLKAKKNLTKCIPCLSPKTNLNERNVIYEE